MTCGAGSHLRCMCHGEHLHFGRQAREARTNRIGHRTTNACINFVEDERRRRATISQHDFECEHKARQFAARRDFHHRAGARARIGLHPEFNPVDAIRPGVIGIRVYLRGEDGALELQRREFCIDRLVETFGRCCARLRQSGGSRLIGF